MQKLLISIVAVVVLASSPVSRADEAPLRAQRHLEWTAQFLPYFSAGDFALDRNDHSYFNLPKSKKLLAERLPAELMKADYPVADLVTQLNHADPKVRTLALAALYDKENPQLLPFFVPLLRDKARTFSAPEPFSCGLGSQPRPMIRQTVADFAAAFLNIYVTSAGCEDFKQYWAARKDRKFSVNWFEVQLARASQVIYPTNADRVDRIRAVRKRIDQVPEPDRTWILLRLHGEAGGDTLVSTDELVGLCKDLGPERLMLMLQHKIPSNDPDLQPGDRDSFRYQQMILFVLLRAPALLRPQDADALFANSERGTTAWWAIAAAELCADKDKAFAVLQRAARQFVGPHQARERAELAAAYWRLVGPATSKILVEWFYTEIAEENTFPNARAAFLRNIAQVRPLENRKLVLDIIQDKRFESLDIQSLEEAANVINEWGKKPSIDVFPLRNASPRNLGNWRAAIVASIPQWSK